MVAKSVVSNNGSSTMRQDRKDIKIVKDAIKFIDLLWENFCHIVRLQGYLRYLFAFLIVIIVAVVLWLGKDYLSAIIDKKSTAEQVAGDTSIIKPPSTTVIPMPTIAFDNNCYTDWIDFSPVYWEGLRSRFEEVGGVYTLPDIRKKVDSVAYYNKPCKGNISASIEFISYSDKLINLNIYYGNWFRWEIGGRDLNSAKLYKNLEGCSAFKNANLVDTNNKYIPDKEKMMIGRTIIASMPVLLTVDGKLRTELHLKFTSAKTGKIVNNRKSFFYEFDVSWKCDENTVLDISKDSERVGIGLMRSSQEEDELPKVKFIKFQITGHLEK